MALDETNNQEETTITPSTDISSSKTSDKPTNGSSNKTTGDLSYNADYSDLETGVNTIETAVKNINENINECNSLIKDIFTESVFMGPFADYCYGTWNDLSELTVQTNSTFDTSAKVLNDNSEAYSASDKNTGEKVGSV